MKLQETITIIENIKADMNIGKINKTNSFIIIGTQSWPEENFFFETK